MRLHCSSFPHKTISKDIKSQTNTGHGVSKYHSQERKRIAWMVPGVRMQLSEEGKNGNCAGGHQRTSCAQTIGPRAYQPSLLTRDNFPGSKQNHDDGRKRSPKWRDHFKKKRKHITDQYQLNEHSRCRNSQMFFQFKMKRD